MTIRSASPHKPQRAAAPLGAPSERAWDSGFTPAPPDSHLLAHLQTADAEAGHEAGAAPPLGRSEPGPRALPGFLPPLPASLSLCTGLPLSVLPCCSHAGHIPVLQTCRVLSGLEVLARVGPSPQKPPFLPLREPAISSFRPPLRRHLLLGGLIKSFDTN